jgi:transcriptional regulator with XRE-family HTH domain
MRQAGRINGISVSAINHYEHGRMDISATRIAQLVESYGYTMQDFSEYLAGKPLPMLSIKAECVGLLDRIDDTKLKAVHAVLTSFVS